jgi:hypothetical protein
MMVEKYSIREKKKPIEWLQFPNVTAAELSSLLTAKGMAVYDTDSEEVKVYENKAWRSFLLADGTKPLSGDWDIGDGRKILADEIRARDADGLALYDDAGNGIFVSDGGNVGFGITAPSEKLEVAGNILLPETGTATDLTQYPSYDLKLTGSAWDSVNLVAIDKTFSLRTIGLTDDSRLGILNNAGTEVVTIKENGNFGIGKTNPGTKLDIISSTAFDTANTGGQDTIAIANSAQSAGLGNYGGSIGFRNLDGARRPVVIAAVQTTLDSDQVGLAFFTHPSTTGSDPIVEQLRIDHNGLVGIGTTAPEEIVHAIGRGYFTEGVRVRQDVADYGGAFSTYTPPTGYGGLIILAADTNATTPGTRLYAYVNGAWKYVDLT